MCNSEMPRARSLSSATGHWQNLGSGLILCVDNPVKSDNVHEEDCMSNRFLNPKPETLVIVASVVFASMV